jgi:cobaltochelatase CobN
MRLISIVWDSHYNTVKRAAKTLQELMDITVFSSRRLEQDPEKMEDALKEAANADAILLYRSTESVWELMEARLQEIGNDVPIVCVGHDPSYWTLTTVSAEIAATVYSYITYNGEENFTSMFRYIAREMCGADIEAPLPKPIPWEGLYHPDAPESFRNIEEYLAWYGPYKTNNGLMNEAGTVGLLVSRFYWVNENIAIENAVIKKFESMGLAVIPAFSYSVKDEGLGTKGSGEVVLECFFDDGGKSRIDALINLQVFLLGADQKNAEDGEIASGGIAVLKKLGVPVFTPITSFYKTIEEWSDDSQGADSTMIGWSISMPEFEGRIEPIIIGGLSNSADELGLRKPIEERIDKLAQRVIRWIRLRKKPVQERKVAFILHNNPCASVEATVGSGAHLDTLETVARVLHRMKESGYGVNPPADGKELIETIMDRKAIAEFRWTTVEEIVDKGGALVLVEKEKYLEWYDELPEKTRERMAGAWGNPPGEAKDDVPAAMVYEGKIVVTGVQYGNAAICVQPKRGCAGARCDGQVCKILHDPDIPPPHQYVATYKWLSRAFGADILVHVGTHGNLEFLPGKGAALSSGCFPDIGVDTMPHLYIYNADNPAEGTIAKRRSCATLVDHMQTVMIQGGLYEELEELSRLLGEYERVKGLDPGRTHALQHLIMESIKKANIDKEIKVYISGKETGKPERTGLSDVSAEQMHALPFDEIVREAHGALSRTRNTQIQDGMHIFGELPAGKRRADFIYSILRYDAGGDASLRREIASMMGLTIGELLSDQGRIHPESKKSYGKLLEEIDLRGKELIQEVIGAENQVSLH